MKTKNLVVGAGPAGTAAAITLARAGKEVLLIDKAHFPRDKCCGDGLTTLALRELERLQFNPEKIKSWKVVKNVIIRSPSGTERVYELPRPPHNEGYFAAVAPRKELDTVLLDLAKANGVKIQLGCCAYDTTVKANSIEVHITDNNKTKRSIHTSNLIAADGMWSPIRKSLQLNEANYRGEWLAYRQYFHNVSGRASQDLIIWFEPDLLPGYAWSFPLTNGRANVGFGIQRGAHSAVNKAKRCWQELLSRPHIVEALGASAVAQSVPKAWPIPARVGRSALCGPRTLFVGDAAAATDPMTGEGIGQALQTGRLAAEAIIDHQNPCDHYPNAVKHELLADDRMSRVLIPLLANPTVTRGVLRFTALTPWIRRNFARWMFEDYPRAMLCTPHRWHRKMFATEGAFKDNLPHESFSRESSAQQN